jgi:pSer/pThr/pTyr-binding forkhead associated (FHA) protein
VNREGPSDVTEPTGDQFAAECGLIRPLQLDLEGLGMAGTQGRLISQPYVVIGRNPAADLVLDHPKVAPRQLYLQVLDGRVFAVDLYGKAEHDQNDDPTRSMFWIDAGQAVDAGPYRVALRTHEQDHATSPETPTSTPPTSRSYPQAGLAEGTLEFPDPTIQPSIWRISRALVLIGWSPLCRVRLTGHGVSRIHASLVRTTSGIWLVDLLGRGGTAVNGLSVRLARLNDGDDLRIGSQRLRIRLEPPNTLPVRRPAPAVPMVVGDPGRDRDRAELARRDGTDLEPLVREIGLMQQQMTEQFQQSMLMMFRMFTDMHQDQMSLIREEMDQLHQLTREQQTLQAALLGSTGTTHDRPTLRLVAAETTPTPTPEDPGRSGTLAPPPPQPAEPSPDPRPRPRPTGTADPDQIHADLVNRLAAIQEERQGRWQRLVESLTGRGS